MENASESVRPVAWSQDALSYWTFLISGFVIGFISTFWKAILCSRFTIDVHEVSSYG